MRKLLLFLFILSLGSKAQNPVILTESMALKLAQMPIKSITLEFPNKPGHIYNSAEEVNFSPRMLHPVFYGSFDWHSSVHGHWMLVRVLKLFPENKNFDEIVKILGNSFFHFLFKGYIINKALCFCSVIIVRR